MTRQHVVRSVFASPAQMDRKPVQRRRRRDAPDCNMVAARLAEAAAILWREKWGPYGYGGLGALTGAAASKPLEKRIGLMIVALSSVLLSVAPPGVRWDASLRTDANGQPLRLVLTRDDPEPLRYALPVRLSARSLRIGDQPALALSSPHAGRKALRAFASEMGTFFGAPVRTEVG